MWDARLHSKKVYDFLWDTKKLITSFDRCNAVRPDEINPKWRETWDMWYHVDQPGYHEKGFQMYQGVLDIQGSGPNDAGTVVVPGSHKRFIEMFENEDMEDAHYFVHIPRDRWKEYVQNPKKVCTQPGDFFIWDSRTIHCNGPSIFTDELKDYYQKNIELKRLICYICMCPEYMATQKVLKNKLEQFMKGKTTTHYPAKYAEVFDHGNLALYKKLKLNDVQMSLTGLPYIK